MDSSSLIDSSLEVNQVGSNQLFYNRYCYSLRFCLEEFHYIRPWHHARQFNDLDSLLSLVDSYREVYSLRRHSSWSVIRSNKTQDELKTNLNTFIETIWPHREVIKVVATTNWGYVYSNDLEILKKIAALPVLDYPYLQQAVINHPVDTIGLRKKKHNYRTYFRDLRITKDQRQKIQTYLAQQEGVRMCPSLRAWGDSDLSFSWIKNVTWCRSSFFFDHQGANDALMLEMMVPGIIRKTLQIVEVNNSNTSTPGN